LDVPREIRGNISALSFLFDGEVKMVGGGDDFSSLSVSVQM
jgi:hypothetical protein